jgi:hypothetical protein
MASMCGCPRHRWPILVCVFTGDVDRRLIAAQHRFPGQHRAHYVVETRSFNPLGETFMGARPIPVDTGDPNRAAITRRRAFHRHVPRRPQQDPSPQR